MKAEDVVVPFYLNSIINQSLVLENMVIANVKIYIFNVSDTKITTLTHVSFCI